MVFDAKLLLVLRSQYFTISTMHKPLESVVVLARFNLSDADIERATAALKNETNWQEWINQIELHGLSGFANKHIDDLSLPIPDALRMPLKALKARHTAAAQARYQTLTEISNILNERGLPFLALKGAALMPHLYREGYLRPMRDMDLLLPFDAEYQAADCLREIGFDVPTTQPSKYMRDMHQRWGDLHFNALEDVQMLHQVSKHLEGLHSGAVLKLINVMDVIGLADHIRTTGQWRRLEAEYPHVINTLRCLHLLTPLPTALQQQVGNLPIQTPQGVGQIMGSLRSALQSKIPLRQRFKRLLLPSDWWLYLYYNVNPNKSLLWIKLVRHPLRIANWLLRRVYSRVLGG